MYSKHNKYPIKLAMNLFLDNTQQFSFQMFGSVENNTTFEGLEKDLKRAFMQ